jgi:hypothetical protein
MICSLGSCRADAAAAAAASGTQLAPGMSAGETDVTDPAKLLVATVKALKVCYVSLGLCILKNLGLQCVACAGRAQCSVAACQQARQM